MKLNLLCLFIIIVNIFVVINSAKIKKEGKTMDDETPNELNL
jgi:hypothetical protein